MDGQWRKQFEETCNKFGIALPPDESLFNYFEKMELLPAQAAFLQLARTYTKPLMKPTVAGEDFEGGCFFLDYNGINIFSAAHVFEVDDCKLFTWYDKNHMLGLTGELFVNPTDNREEDLIDIGFFKPKDEMAADLATAKNMKLATLENIEEIASGDGRFCLIGFPGTRHDIDKAKRKRAWSFTDYPYLLTEVSDECYEALMPLNVYKTTHLAFEWNKRQWQPRNFQYNKSVKLKGFSGSPIWNLNNGRIAAVFNTLLEQNELKTDHGIRINYPKIGLALRSQAFIGKLKEQELERDTDPRIGGYHCLNIVAITTV